MRKEKQIFWSLFFPVQPNKILIGIAEGIKQNSINKQLNIYRIIQSILFGIMCSISSILFIDFFNNIIPLYINRGGYDWIEVYVKIKIFIPFIFFALGIVLVNINYFLLYFFTFIDQTKHFIDYKTFKKALIVGYADLSSTIILIILIAIITISKRNSFFDFLITRNMDQYALQEQIIMTFYKPVSYIIMFLIFKTIIQLNSARKCAIIIRHIFPKEKSFYYSLRIAVISIFLKKAFFIALSLLIFSISIYLSQYITAEFITIK